MKKNGQQKLIGRSYYISLSESIDHLSIMHLKFCFIAMNMLFLAFW